MEFWIIFVVEVYVIVSRASKVVLNVEVFTLVEVTFMVNMIEVLNWPLILRGNKVLNSSVLNCWFNLE